MRKFFTLVFLITVCFSYALAQTKTITGTVKDGSTMESLPGVTITSSSGQSTQTNADGYFSIEVSSNANITITFIGYKPQTIPVSSQSTYNIFLERDSQELEEVVVVGYGTQKKADVTGSIGSVKGEEIAKQPSMSAMQSVQGKVAGLNIVASENPGSAPTVMIRGLGTALGGRNPLYIVDGIPVTNINNINPTDIESMDVLKDASSASIYGLRAANGVVIVTTKKGKAGRFNINYESYAGIKNILNRVEMANGQQYATYVNENLQAINGGYSLQTSGQPYETDWYEALLKQGSIFNNAVNLSGGSERIDYYLSVNNFTENGILDGSRFIRNTFRNNNTYKFMDGRLKFDQNVNLTLTKNTPKPLNAFNAAYRQSPLVPVMYANGRYGVPFVNKTTGLVTYEGQPGDNIGSLNSIGNPVYEVLRNNNLQNTTTLQGSFEGEFKIVDYLKFNSRFGATKFWYNGRTFNNIKHGWLNADPTRTESEFETLRTNNPTSTSYAYNSLNISQNESFRWVWENFLTFQKSFDRHHVEAILGMSREKFDIASSMSASAYDVPEKEQYWNIDLANTSGSSAYPKTVNQTSYTPIALASYFGRIQYNYDNRYYLTATVRRDGSSVFKANENYWGTFPSFGAGWTISNEEFMQEASWINFLKVRANWGELGNQQIPLNVSQILTSPGSSNYNYVFGPEQTLVFGAAFGTPAVDLTWEKTREAGVGLDFGFLNNNLSGSIDYYHKLNTNTILDVTPTLNSSYARNFYAHGAKVLNQGFEAILTWSKTLSEDFNYSFGVNYAYNSNKVKEVTPAYDGATGGSLANGQITKQLRVGQPIYAWWMWEADGVWQTAEEIANNPRYGSPIPGHLRYKDQNEDGVIDNRDKVFFGSYIPSSTYGINLAVNYKKVDFAVYGYGVAGNKVYNALKGTRIDGGENITAETFKQRWTGPGSTNVHPGAARDSYASSYYLESGSYFRINNITLGYTFSRLYSNTSKLRLYVTAQNPFIFTKYSGFSPEISGVSEAATGIGYSNAGSPSGTSGIELSAYPTTRNFLFGLNLQF